MGCGASSRAPAEGAEHQAPVREATPHAILIEKAQKLSRDVDIMGPADPFVIIRLGPVGAAWSAKARETERVSDTCWNTVSPTWNFAFRFAAPPPGADWELHCRVFDKDDLSSDDFMGECLVPLAALRAHEDERREYPMRAPAQGSLTIMAGARVSAALLAELTTALEAELRDEEEKAAAAERGLGASLLAPLGWLTSKLSGWFNEQAGGALYYRNVAALAVAWNQEPKPGDDAASKCVSSRVSSRSRERWECPALIATDER